MDIKGVVIGFVAGAAVGAGVMHLINKKKWAQYEIVEPVTEKKEEKKEEKDFSEFMNPPVEETTVTEVEDKTYPDIIEDLGYSSPVKNEVNYLSLTRRCCYAVNIMTPPVEVDEAEYNATDDNWLNIVLALTTDGVIADDADLPVNDFELDRLIGLSKQEILDRFEEDETITDLFFRNDDCNAYFQVSKFTIPFEFLTHLPLERYSDMDKFGHGKWEGGLSGD